MIDKHSVSPDNFSQSLAPSLGRHGAVGTRHTETRETAPLPQHPHLLENLPNGKCSGPRQQTIENLENSESVVGVREARLRSSRYANFKFIFQHNAHFLSREYSHRFH